MTVRLLVPYLNCTRARINAVPADRPPRSAALSLSDQNLSTRPSVHGTLDHLRSSSGSSFDFERSPPSELPFNRREASSDQTTSPAARLSSEQTLCSSSGLHLPA